jgi:hypothetical protein
MRTQFAIAGGNAKSESGRLCTENARAVHLNRSLALCAKSVFSKPVQTLMDLFKIGERDAKYRLAADRKFTAVELQTLLQTEEGIQFLVTIMADARPKWWRAVQRLSLMGSVVRRREADAEMLRRFADADQVAVQTIPAALRVLDADFFEPVVEAMAAVTRPPAGPVAPATRRPRR